MQFLRTFATAALALGGALAAPAARRAETTVDRVTWKSSGVDIVGYHYHSTSQNKPSPAVIIAHGLGGLQTSRLQPYAEQFAAAGYNAFTFDYRYWGQSAGEPRNLIDVASQQADYLAAIEAAKTFPGVDGRIVLWGTSLSGGHVLELGSKDPALAGIIAQAPHTNGPKTVSALPPASLPGLIAAGLEDQTAGLVAPNYIPLANKTGEFGALTQEGAYEGYQFIQPTSPAPGNVFPARFVLELPFFNPDALEAIRAPVFMGVGSTDNVTPKEPAIALAKRIGAELHEYPGGHFSVYPGAANYDAVQRDQLAFLKKNVPV